MADATVDRTGRSGAALVTVLGMMLGVIAYGLVVFAVAVQMDPQHFGRRIYDEMFLALLEGQLDLPARILALEGHYTVDGTGFLYHGAAPLLTRLVASPFSDLSQQSLAAFSIWFWACLGTALWHAAFFRAARARWPEDGLEAGVWSGLLAAAVWLGGPGLLLACNVSLFHEPIAVAYGLGAGVAFLWTTAVHRNWPLHRILVGMSVLAALCVFARPNVAIGLYLAVGLACATTLLRDGRPAIVSSVLALAILGAGGGGYLAYNQARFGDIAVSHGSFESAPLQYGSTFWGWEEPDAPRAQAFTDHGRFNPGRILPNAAFYLLGPPEVIAPPLHRAAADLHASVTYRWLGAIRIESPGAGLIFLWAPWIVLSMVALTAPLRELKPYAGLLFGLAGSVLLLFSYATITLRYRIDLWPLVATLSVIGIGAITPRLASRSVNESVAKVLVAAVFLGAVSTGLTAMAYRYAFTERPGSFFTPWTEDVCASFAKEKGFDAQRTAEICMRPRTG